MKKKTKRLTAIGIATGLLMACGTGAMAYAAGNPYETYKAAALDTAQQTNMTADVSAQVKQNGKSFISGQMTLQRDGATSYSVGSVDIQGQKKDMEQSTKDGVTITRDGKVYTSRQSNGHHDDWEKESLSPNTQKLFNMITDTLVGDVKNQFTENGKTISVHLDSAQVPELANVAFAAAVEMQGKYEKQDKKDPMELQLDKAFSIKKDAKVKSLDVKAILSNGYLTSQDITAVLAGLDAKGKATEVKITLHYDLSKIGSTVPQTVDTKGKTVKKVAEERD